MINKRRVQINEMKVKPSKEVSPGDKLRIVKDQVNYECEILQLPKSRVGAKYVPLYIKDITPADQVNKKELRSLAQSQYRAKGQGRPTKKQRRDLDDYLNEDFLFEDFQ